ncbi:STAS domain-containing protein [Belnapia sp. T18]|uniref:Anti-sigma factor antagonist n=1 Tax=Belnapia arida TaxID=2804533 RepID=A0ABS1TWZ2_9PROT|nr:STAS domain-containing protein [Belnapia arida]MBL6076919.1 STAS domain-containing protein [Belnapia arida]
MDFALTELDNGTNRVAMSGRLDAAGAEAIDQRFTAAVGSVAKNALVDLTEVSFVASLGLRMFISVARVLQRRGAQMILFGAQRQVMEVFETIALDQMIPIVATEAEARARLTT